MTAAGWVFLITSLAFVWTLTLWCFYRVLTLHEEPPGPVRQFHSA
jgi:amino acid permease